MRNPQAELFRRGSDGSTGARLGRASVVAPGVIVAHPATANKASALFPDAATAVPLRCVVARGDPDSTVLDGIAYRSSPSLGSLVGVFLDKAPWKGDYTELDVAENASAEKLVAAFKRRISVDASISTTQGAVAEEPDPDPSDPSDPDDPGWRPRLLYCLIWPQRPDCK